MSRIDDVARGLTQRWPRGADSAGLRADAADLALERMARSLATPMPRRRALRVLGGALITTAVPTSLLSPARATALSLAGCTACGVEHGEGCVGNYKCGQGALIDEPVCCRWPGYFGVIDNSRGGICAGAGGKGETPPGGAMCCCPTGYSCGDPAIAACVCPKPCGIGCCKPDDECIEWPGADVDEDLFCGPPCDDLRCFSGEGSHCCTESDCCGTGCCEDGTTCCGDTLDAEVCCEYVMGYACSGEGGCGCEASQQCGPKCCPKGTTCGRGLVAPGERDRSHQCYGPDDFYNPVLDKLFDVFRFVHGLSVSTSSGARSAAAAATGSADATVAIAAVASLAVLAHDRFRFGRPDSAYGRPAKLLVPRLRPIAPGPDLSPSAAQALDELLLAEARALALVNAAAVAHARSLGAIRAGKLAAARRQARAYGRFAGRAARQLRKLPALRRNAAAALQAGGTPELTVTTSQVQAFQDAVRANGLPADMRARLTQLGLGRADQRRVGRIIVAAAPQSGPVLIAPLTEASRLDGIAKLSKHFARTAARVRRRPIRVSRPGPARVRGKIPIAASTSQPRRRGSP